MQKVWESKKWLAFAVCVVVSIATLIVNQRFGLNLDPNIIFGLLGLNVLYTLVQGKIDAKNPADHVGKKFFESHKFISLVVGYVVPILVGWANGQFNLTIPPELIWGLLGIDSVYLLRKGMLDLKEPANH